jgi:hypothetical protein
MSMEYILYFSGEKQNFSFRAKRAGCGRKTLLINPTKTRPRNIKFNFSLFI